MSATEEVLKSIIESYKQVESSSCSGIQLLNKCMDIREGLIIIIKQQLLNTEAIACEIVKAKDESSQTQTVLNFFDYLIDGFPYPVFVPSSEQCKLMKCNELEGYIKSYKDFMFLLASRLIQLTTFDELKLLHISANKILFSWIDLMKMQNFMIYNIFIKELLQLFIELHESEKVYYPIDNDESEDITIRLRSFQVTLQKQEDVTLQILSFDHLERWQIKIAELLQVFAGDLNAFLTNQYDKMFQVIQHQVFSGRFQLKCTSLHLCMQLVQYNHVLSESVVQCIMKFIIPLVEYTISLKCKDLNDLENDVAIYYKTIKEFLQKIFFVCFPKDGVFQLSSSRICFHIDLYNLNILINCTISAFSNIHKIPEIILCFCSFISASTYKKLRFNPLDFNKPVISSLAAIAELLIFNFAEMKNLPLFSPTLTNFLELFCYMDNIISSNLESKRNITTISGCKRLCGTDVSKSIIGNSTKSNFSIVCVHLEKGFDVLLHDLEKYLVSKNKPAADIFHEVSKNIHNLLVLFKSFYSSCCILQEVDLCKHIILKTMSNSNFESIFSQYIEIIITYFCQNTLKDLVIDPSCRIFENLVKLSKCFLFWYKDICSKWNSSGIDHKRQQCFSSVLIIFSCIWFECMPWKDLKNIIMSRFSQSALQSFCQNLGLSRFSVMNLSDKNTETLSVIQDCIEGIAFFPEEISISWRISIITEWAFSSNSDQLELATLQSCVCFCRNLQSVKVLPVIDALISFIKSKSQFNKNEFLIMQLLESLLPLIWVMCGNVSYCVKPIFNGVNIKLSPQMVWDEKKEIPQIDEDILKRVFEIEGLLYNFLSSTCNNSNTLHIQYIKTINNIFPFLNTTKQASHTMLSHWIKCFDSKNGIPAIKPDFIILDDDVCLWNSLLLKEAEIILKIALKENKVSTLCNLAGLFGSIINYCAAKECIIYGIFLKSIQLIAKISCSSNSKVRTFTFIELQKFAANHQMVLQNSRKFFSSSVAEYLVGNYDKCGQALLILENASKLYNTSLHNYLLQNMQYILPPFAINAMQFGKVDLLQMLSTSLDCNKADLIKQNFKYIFCYAVTNGADLGALFNFLEKLTKFKKESLILVTYGSLIQHLMAHISIDKTHVCDALQLIQQVKSNSDTCLSISELLKPHFLSVLTFFNSQLRLNNVSVLEKLQVYESLISLLYLLDTSYITAVFVKVMNTLCLAQLVFINSPKAGLCCKGWHALACCIEDAYLGNFLSQIVVMLLPCLDKYPDKVASTLEYLVIEKCQFTKKNFSELYFLPNHEDLRNIKSHIEKTLKHSTTSSAKFLSTLTQATHHLSHDSSEVRLCALTHVHKIVQMNQKSVQRQCFVSGNVSDLIQSLVSALLTCCRDSNPQIKLLSAKCLGEIGAIDPDRLSLLIVDKSKDKLCTSFDEEDFAFNLLDCLVQAFLVAKPSHQDISAFAIQEVLKIYNCKSDTKDINGRRLWQRFSEQVQAVLEPHLSSRYVLKKSVINFFTMKRPILHRKDQMNFQEWIGTFCAVLMQMTSSLNQESSTICGVFDACAAIVRSNVDVALFLLSPTIIELLKMDEHLDFLQEEFSAVLKSTEMLQDENWLPKSIVDIHDTSDGVIQNSSLYSTSSSYLSQLSAQAIFSVMDHITLWLHHSLSTAGSSGSRTKQREKEQANKFLSLIPQKKFAFAALRCKDYTRALLHYEKFLRESPDGVISADSAAFLQRIFIEMNEPDGVLGVVNVRENEPTLETQLLLFESTGALQDAASCYERLISNEPSNMVHYKGFFQCLIDLGQLSEAVNLIDGTLSNYPGWKNELASYSIEACWRLGKWDILEQKVKSLTCHETKSWSIGIGKAILAIREKNWKDLDSLLDGLYQTQVTPLAVACMETNSFQRGYEHILRLHTLSDLERFSKIIRNRSQSTEIDDVVSLWQLRLKVVQSSFRACDPILSLGRVLLPLIYNTSDKNPNCDRHVGKMWLQSSKLARNCGLLQTAYGALLSAQVHSVSGYCIDHAKLLWKKGESHQALLTLQKGFAKHSPNSCTVTPEQKRERAKVMLLEAKLMEESSSYDSNAVLRKYKEVVNYLNDWEDSHFYCGRYYDKLMTTVMGDNKPPKAHHLYYIMSHYGRSLCFGTSHIYESLTKLLTLWLDYGETAAKLEKAGKPQSVEDVQRLMEVIVDVRSRLPAYIFYTAFSQLTSRICHQHQPTYNHLKEILVSVMLAFPQRALWSMIAISKSSFQQRASRCQDIFDRVVYKEPNLGKLVSDTVTLTNRLLDLCNKPVSNVQPLSISTHFKQLKKLFDSGNISEIMLPLQRFMNVILPQSKQNSMLDSQSSHNPFPEIAAHIVGFDDSVEILSSLQRPKKISVRASDGKSYAFLCKPKDDLRKDARLTEFAAIVNKCLHRDAESGKRHLRIRTYAVIPLNEECGLIEWINNMKGLRHILLPIYKAKGFYCSVKQLKTWQLPVSAPLQKKLEAFRKKFLPRHPPVFHEWFLTTFTDPSSWYSARLAYARSVAVMSMVGYILGLGDRHGENILFDSYSGEAMHVDFNCLFNKGLSLEVPEIVPFRLTQNMVDAMGITKYEGFFRKACEVTMNVLREQREPLMSVLKTFIYDPLVEWSKMSRAATSSGEILTEKALSHVNDIDKRLRGIVGKGKGLPLSIEGHVHYLIQEATDEEKLCQMYIGWAPFM